MIYNSYVQEENIKPVPEELIEDFDVVKEKPIDGIYEKYREEFSYHKVSDELREWLKNELRMTLLPEKEKFFYYIGQDTDKFVDNRIQEILFYPVKFEDNQWRFWNQWFENERINN